MSNLHTQIEQVFSDRDLAPSDVPQLDLYMDQVLSLFEQGFASDKRDPTDKILTKTMINNYVKEGLLSPVRGKKYTRQQIMQLLCIYHLKQTLRLSDVKTLTGRDDVDFARCYERLLADKERMRESIPASLQPLLPDDPDDPEALLSCCLALSEIALYMRRLCERLLDAAPTSDKGEN